MLVEFVVRDLLLAVGADGHLGGLQAAAALGLGARDVVVADAHRGLGGGRGAGGLGGFAGGGAFGDGERVRVRVRWGHC